MSKGLGTSIPSDSRRDSAVRFKNGQARILDCHRRVDLVSLLAKEYPQVMDQLKARLHSSPPAYENAV